MARKPPTIAWNSQNTTQDNICGGAVSPVAKTLLLIMADAAVVDAGAGEYASPFHCAELNIAGGADRCIVDVIVPPGTTDLQWSATRCGVNNGLGGAGQAATGASSTVGGGYVAPNISVANSAVAGAETFLHFGVAGEITGGTTQAPAPAANTARTLPVTAQLAPYAEACEIRQCVGFTFWPVYRTADLETL